MGRTICCCGGRIICGGGRSMPARSIEAARRAFGARRERSKGEQRTAIYSPGCGIMPGGPGPGMPGMKGLGIPGKGMPVGIIMPGRIPGIPYCPGWGCMLPPSKLPSTKLWSKLITKEWPLNPSRTLLVHPTAANWLSARYSSLVRPFSIK